VSDVRTTRFSGQVLPHIGQKQLMMIPVDALRRLVTGKGI
jgi:hypothetical protein